MLIVSREATVRIGRHAWNVYPLEAFGYLLGRRAQNRLLAALPNSKTSRWHDFDDRWNGIEANLPLAQSVATRFGLEVIGFYRSAQNFFSPPDDHAPIELDGLKPLQLTYLTICCPQCSIYELRSASGECVCRGWLVGRALAQADAGRGHRQADHRRLAAGREDRLQGAQLRAGRACGRSQRERDTAASAGGVAGPGSLDEPRIQRRLHVPRWAIRLSRFR